MFSELLCLGHKWWSFCVLPISLSSNCVFLWSFPVYFLALFVLTHCGNDEGVVLPLLTPKGNTVVFLKLGWLFFIISVVFYKNFLLSNHSALKNPQIFLKWSLTGSDYFSQYLILIELARTQCAITAVCSARGMHWMITNFSVYLGHTA